MLPVALLFVAFFDSTTSETGNAYHGPPQSRELFAYNNHLYYFYSERCSYDEADAICEAGSMHLAILDDPGKAKFAAESIAEAWMVLENMWIGGRKTDVGKWHWTFIKKDIPTEPQMIGNFTYLYPPWVDNEPPERDGKDCLAIDKTGHNDPYFIDLDCKLPRPFICEPNTQVDNTDPWSDGVVQIFDLEFILYHGRLSWSAAVSFCRQQGFALATVENMTIAEKLAKTMLKSRPEFEDAWIGANFKGDEWTWVENGQEVKTIPAEYKDPSKGDIPENIITPQFPPWFEPVRRKGRECVIFDRHLCAEPTFIDIKCNRQRDFICIKRQEEPDAGSLPVILDRDKKRYIFYHISVTWDEAKTLCEEEDDNSNMLTLTDAEETKFIMQAMSDAKNPLNHIWLGGKIVDGRWAWVTRNEDQGMPISVSPDDTGFPPWCDNDTNIEMSCLNLDRQSYLTPLMYGLECNSTQAVVCVMPVESNDRIVDYDGAGKQDPPVKLRITKLKRNPKSWFEAEKACTHDIGRLWKPRFDLPNAESAIKKFFENVKSGQSSDKSSLSVVYHVDGGRYSAKKKVWIRDRQKLQINTAWDPYDGDCLVGQINDTATEWTWFPVKCHHKLYSEIICQPICSITEVPYEAENSEWLCDASTSEAFDHKMINMGCTHHCPEGSVNQGPDRFICSKKGWIGKEAAVPVNASECKDVVAGLEKFKQIPNGITSLAFVIDSTSKSETDYNATKFLVGNLIDFYRANLPQGLTVQVISIELREDGRENAIHKAVDFKPTEDCEQIKTVVLDNLKDQGLGPRDYFAGLSMAKDALAASLGKSNIVFVVPEANQKNSFKKTAMEINKVAKVFAIGTNKHAPVSQLVAVASNINGINYAIQFKKPSDVITSVRSLIQSCSQCKCGNTFDYLATKFEKLSDEHKPSEANNPENVNPAAAQVIAPQVIAAKPTTVARESKSSTVPQTSESIIRGPSLETTKGIVIPNATTSAPVSEATTAASASKATTTASVSEATTAALISKATTIAPASQNTTVAPTSAQTTIKT